MPYCGRIDKSKGIDLAKSRKSKECMICRYWFFDHGFKFQDYVCNVCHDLTMLCLNISDITISNVKNVDYCCNLVPSASFRYKRKAKKRPWNTSNR